MIQAGKGRRGLDEFLSVEMITGEMDRDQLLILVEDDFAGNAKHIPDQA